MEWHEIPPHAHSSTQLKTNELFISGIFHLIFSDRVWLWVTETTGSETTDGGWGDY